MQGTSLNKKGVLKPTELTFGAGKDLSRCLTPTQET